MTAIDRGQALDRGQAFVDDGHAPAARRPIDVLEPPAISATETGRRLRSALKAHYPAVRFRVRVVRGIERSIDIEWTGGPSADEVATVIGDYIGGGYRPDDLVGDGGEDDDLSRRGLEAQGEGIRYDVTRIEVCRLKADGSIDVNRLAYGREGE